MAEQGTVFHRPFYLSTWIRPVGMEMDPSAAPMGLPVLLRLDRWDKMERENKFFRAFHDTNPLSGGRIGGNPKGDASVECDMVRGTSGSSHMKMLTRVSHCALRDPCESAFRVSHTYIHTHRHVYNIPYVHMHIPSDPLSVTRQTTHLLLCDVSRRVSTEQTHQSTAPRVIQPRTSNPNFEQKYK